MLPVQIDNAGSIFERLIEEGIGAFDLGQISTDGLFDDPLKVEEALDKLDGVDSSVKLNQVGNDLEYKIQITKDLEAVVELDIEASLPGGIGTVALSGLVEVSADVILDVVLGVDSQGFYITPDTDAHELVIKNLVVDGAINGSGRFGFLGVDLTDGQIELDEAVAINLDLVDPGLIDDEKIRLPELRLASPSEFLVADVDGDMNDSTTDLKLTGTFNLSPIVPGFDFPTDLLDAELTISWADITRIDEVTLGPLESDFVKLVQMTSQDVLQQLTEIQTQVNAVAESAAFVGIELPFVEEGIDQLIDLATLVQEKVIDPLTSFGGTTTLPTAQEFVVKLAAGLGIDLAAIGSTLENGELTYDLNLARTVSFEEMLDLGFDLGDGIADIELATAANFEGSISLDVTFGVDIRQLSSLLTTADPGAFLESFFIRDASVTASANFSATDLTGRARLGFLEVEVGPYGGDPSTSFVRSTSPLTVEVSLQDPDGTQAGDAGDTDGGRITLQELIDHLGTPSNLIGSPEIHGSLEASLPLGASILGLTVPPSAATTVMITMSNISDLDTLNVVLPDPIGDFREMLNFDNLTAAEFVSQLAGLATQLERLRRSDLIASLDIPFVDGAIDKVLGFADTLSDGVFYGDGADETRDGQDKLIGDINAALAVAGLDAQIVVQGDGTKIRFEAIDESITGFSMSPSPDDASGYASLGLSNPAAAVLDAATYVVETTPGSMTGVLTGSAGIRFSISRGSDTTDVDVIIAADDTAENTGIGDDVIKLVRADNSATFDTVQGLTFRLNQLLETPDLVTYHPSDDRLEINIGSLIPSLDFQEDFDLGFDLDLSPLLDLTSDTTMQLQAGIGLDLIMGVYLGDTVPGAAGDLTGATELSMVNDGEGVDIRTTPAVTAPAPVDAIKGRLQNDATITLSITDVTGTRSSTFVVKASDTALNNSAMDLAADLGAALAVASVRQWAGRGFCRIGGC